jgi:hypothetical protein
MPYTNALYEAAQGTLAGFGAGIVTNTVFQAATNSVSTVSSAISGPLVLALTAIGFGVGLMSGHKKDLSAAPTA